MKKTIAAVGATALGIGGALVAAAGPASAVTPNCTNSEQHEVNPAVGPGDSWYMTCIPQYGMGKAEFTITTGDSSPFPVGYNLTDGHQTVTSSPTSAQVKAYFNQEWTDLDPSTPAVYTGAFVNLNQDTGASSDTSQAYDANDIEDENAMTVAYPIESVGIATAGLPAACTPLGSGATYEGEYVVVYGTTTTRFTETIDDVVRSATISYTPPPLYLGLNFNSSDPALGFDETKAICASSGGQTTFATSFDESDPTNSIDWISAAYNATTFPPTLETLSPADGSIADISDPADIIGATTTDFGSFATTATPVLATTGIDPRPAGTLGAGLLSVGILATVVGVVRRRRRALLDPR